MAATNINRVVLTGNLTRDPELRTTAERHLRSAACAWPCNTRRKDARGEWVDKPNYFDVTVWGAQGENCAQYLSKGRPVAIDGRLEWREWEDKERQASARRSTSSPTPSSSSAAARTAATATASRFTPQSDVPGRHRRLPARARRRPAPPTTTSRSETPVPHPKEAACGHSPRTSARRDATVYPCAADRTASGGGLHR